MDLIGKLKVSALVEARKHTEIARQITAILSNVNTNMFGRALKSSINTSRNGANPCLVTKTLSLGSCHAYVYSI